jgi:hypothetical protein
MVHLPHRPVSKRESPYYHDANGLPISYQEGQEQDEEEATSSIHMSGGSRRTFEQLVAMVQQQVIARTEEERMSSIGITTPKMRLRGDLNQNQHHGENGNGEQEYELYEDEHGQVYEYEYSAAQATNTNPNTNMGPPRMRLRDPQHSGEDGQGPQYAYQEATNNSGPPRMMRLREDSHLAHNNERQSPRNAPPRRKLLQGTMMVMDGPKDDAEAYESQPTTMTTPRSRDTPKMRLREFAAGNGRVVRTVKHVPRMRLKDFAPNDSSTPGTGTEDEQVQQLLLEEEQRLLEESTSGQGKVAPPKMRLRQLHGTEDEQVQQLLLEEEQRLMEESTSGQGKAAPPKMRLHQLHGTEDEQVEQLLLEQEQRLLEESTSSQGKADPPKMLLHQLYGNENDESRQGQATSGPNKTEPPKMRLRQYAAGQEQQQHDDEDHSLEGTPKMRLRQYAAGQEQQQHEEEQEEKKVTDPEAPLRRRKEHPLSQNFLSVSTDPSQYSSTRAVGKLSPGTTCCSKCLQPTPTGSQATASSDFFAQMRTQSVEDATILEQGGCPDCGQQGEQQQEQVEDPNSTLYSSVSPLNQDPPRINSEAQSSVSSLNHQDPRASSGAYSSVSPLNREDGGNGKDSSSTPHEKSKDDPQGGLYDDEHNSITPRGGKDDPQGGLYDGENNGVTPRKSTASGRGFQDNDETKSETSFSGLWNRGRASLQTAITSTLNVIPEAKNSSPPNLQARAANVQGQVGGFFNSMLRGSKQEENEMNEDSLALAAYRKTQEVKRESMSPDDASSSSSYRVLPAGLRSVVQGLYKSPTNQRPSSPALSSPARSTLTRSSIGELSPEIYKDAHANVMRKSELLGGYNQEGSIIDTDDTRSQASGIGMDPNIVASMMMSPTLLNKRLLQAVRAVEANHWQQVSYLISANPW